MVLVLGFSLLSTLLASSTASRGILPVECPDAQSDGTTHHLVHPTGDCRRYIVCAGTRKIEQSCPNGFQWNSLDATCTVPLNDATPCSHSVGPTKAHGGVVSSKCPAQLDRCPLETNPAEEVILLPHPADCRKFYACVSTVPIELHCPKGLYWDHGACRCDFERPSGHCVADGSLWKAEHRIRVRETEDDTTTTTTETPILPSGARGLKALSSILLLIGTLALNH